MQDSEDTGEDYYSRAQAAMEELLADAHSGMNAFDAGATKFKDTVNRFLDENHISRRMEQENGVRETNGLPAERYSVDEIEGDEADYGLGVILDTNIFDGVRPRAWGTVLGKYVYSNLAGTQLTVYDEQGNEESIFIAKPNDRVTKDGAKNSHKVIDKLARYRGDNIKALATVHLSELLETSRHENTTSEHSHQWLDENGWEYRKTYIQDKAGNIYEATLNIANGRDRKILYEINNVRRIDKKRAARGVVPSTNNGRGSLTKSNSSQEMIAEHSKFVKDESSSDSYMTDREFRERYGLKLPTLDEAENATDSQALGKAENQKKPRERFSVDDSDQEYLDAVERGDMETAQRMVDEAAKAAGYTRLFYHGSKKGGGFTTFRDWSY